MATKRTKSTEKKTFIENLRERFTPRVQRELAGIVFLAFAVFTGVSLLRLAFGGIGEAWAKLLWSLFGWGAYALPVIAMIASFLLMRRTTSLTQGVAWGRVFAFEIFCTAVLALIHLLTPASVNAGALAEGGEGGGFVGYALSSPIGNALGVAGGTIVLIAIVLFTLPAVLGLSATRLHAWSDALAARANVEPKSKPAAPASASPGQEKIKPEPKSKVEPTPRVQPTAPNATPPVFGKPIQPRLPMKPATPQLILAPRNRVRRRGNPLPPIDLLDVSNESKYGETDANRKARLIEETLDNFGVPAKVVEINAGPTITQFGLEPGFVERRGTDGVVRQRKVPVNRISALQHDLELALAAAPIRIETPVPGRAIVGIEVPNHSVSLVSMRGVVESEQFKKKKSPLRVALGRDVSGSSAVADLQSMPHLLIAGATGSGKSVCVNTIIACLLMNNSPDELRFVMVDPKRVELTAYNGIPHLLGPVITNMQEVVPALRWVVREMDARFTLFAKVRVRNIEAFNEKMEKENGEHHMPYMVAMIDELADLMLAAPDETEKLLTRLAQMARATGIHLVIATQRPSVNVVTGLIKANFPSRISFAVTSSVDSRVVLDTTGAEKLLGKGDMLYMASDSSKLSRLQGCFVSDDEITRLVHFWREKAITDLRDVPQDAPWKAMGDVKEGGDEALIEQAIEIAQQFDRTSISFLQRKLGIGYPRAARLMDQLEERGIVGPDEGGGKPRAVLIHESEVKEFEAEELPNKKK